MNWFEKIKSMNKTELAEFLANFDFEDIDDVYCRDACVEKNTDGRCKHIYDCPFEDSFVIEKWLETKADTNN